jgi:hypothetical protein
MNAILQSKFPLGQVVITANAQHAIHPADVHLALARHAQGDWGDLCSRPVRHHRFTPSRLLRKEISHEEISRIRCRPNPRNL